MSESISQLPLATQANATDLIPATQGSIGPGTGTTRAVTQAQIMAAGGTVTSNITLDAGGGWSSNNVGKQLLVTTPAAASNPGIGITDSNGANLWGVWNHSGVLTMSVMPAYSDDVTGPINIAALSSTGVAVTGTLSSSGALAVTSGGATITAGGLTVSAGGAAITGITTLSAALQMPNNTAIQMKDSGGTSRNVLFVDTLNNTNIESAATGIRFLNQANSVALLTCLNNGVITTSADITSGTGYGSRQGSGGGTSGNLFNVYWNGAGAFLYIDANNLGQFSFVSDRRIKHLIQDNPTGALERVMALRAVTYRFDNIGIFKDDGRTRTGFIADEVAAVVPSAIDGEVGGLDEQGNPALQTINPVPLIAELTAAVQQLNVRLTALEAKAQTP